MDAILHQNRPASLASTANKSRKRTLSETSKTEEEDGPSSSKLFEKCWSLEPSYEKVRVEVDTLTSHMLTHFRLKTYKNYNYHCREQNKFFSNYLPYGITLSVLYFNLNFQVFF